MKSFLATCGEPNLEFLTQPARLHKALEVLDTSKDGEVDMEECTASRRLTYFSSDRRACSAAWRCASLTARLGWHGRSSPRTPGSLVDVRTGEEAINRGLAKRLAQLAAERERRERAAEKADAEFSVEFLNAARKCFEMIDVDESGTLEKAEMSARRVRPSTRARRRVGGRSSCP